jgi:hypothetical protein
MRKHLKRIAFLVSLFLMYLVGKEMVQLYHYASAIHPYFAYGLFGLLGVLFIFYAVVPVAAILRMPRYEPPTTDEAETADVLARRVARLKRNPYLVASGFDVASLEPTPESYAAAIAPLKEEARRVRKRYVAHLFYSTAISQNGFLDAALILSAHVNLTKDLFTLYGGRATARDLWAVAKRLYYSVAVGGSEGVEYAADELFSKLATETAKSVPFISRVVGSAADGFVNAAFLTRSALIVENYLTKYHIQSERELYPRAKTIVDAARSALGDILDKITNRAAAFGKERVWDSIKRSGASVKRFLEEALAPDPPPPKPERLPPAT